MTSDERALLEAIHTDPDEDAPRLVYADWLEESGTVPNQTRAEFIRCHIRLAQLDELDPAYDSLDARCRELVRSHGDTWTKVEEGAKQRFFGYDEGGRGFEKYGMLSDTDLENAESLPELKHCVLSELHLYNLMPDSPLIAWPRLRNVRKLSFYCECYERDMPTLRRLLASPGLAQLEELDLENSDLNDEDVEWIVRHPNFVRLKTLALGSTRSRGYYGDRSISAIVGTNTLRNLEGLRLRGMTLSSSVLRSVARAPFYPRLRALRFDDLRCDETLIGPIVEELLEDARLGPLDTLQLRYIDMSDDSLAVETLGLRFPRLRRLDFRENRLTSETAARIVSSPWSARLVELDLSENDLHGDWLRQFRSTAMNSVRNLQLRHCGLTPGNIEQLAASPALRSVRTLDLSNNPIGDKGARALARSRHLEYLRSIRLQSCGIGPEGVRALAASPLKARITAYDLDYNGFERRWLIANGAELFGWDERDIDFLQATEDMMESILSPTQ